MSNEIQWEPHDEYDEGYQSTCGEFEIRIDPTYGYFSLIKSEDSTESLEENRDQKVLMDRAHLYRTPSAT